MPQRSILFSLYINDLLSVCTVSEVPMYADDTVMHAKSKQATQTHYCNGPDDKVAQGLMFASQCKRNTVCMFLTKRTTDATEPDVYVSEEKL